jgi:cystathionine gamma-lyase
MKFQTRAIHAGSEPDKTTGATIPAISLSTTYTQGIPGEHKGYEYSRSQNPTRENLEACLAALEEGEACAAFGSGLAATMTLLSTLRPGDGVVAGHDLYGGTYRQMERHFRPWGLEIVYTDDASEAAYARAIAKLARPKLMWLETPTNPLLDVVDIAAASAHGHKANMLVVVDNTFASPALQQPLKLGADLVVHSTTKYIGGHSDVVGGAVIAKTKALLEPIRFLQNAIGAVPGPMDTYLTQRGAKTLGLRMERHCQNAMAMAEELKKLPGIARIIYPGLADHPGHAIAKRQMCGFGGMVSIVLEGDFERTKQVCSRMKLFSVAESLGGVESLCCHPTSMTHGSIPREIREARGITDSLLRLSVGVEHVEDLIADVRQAITG